MAYSQSERTFLIWSRIGLQSRQLGMIWAPMAGSFLNRDGGPWALVTGSR